MKERSLKYYTLRHLFAAILAGIAVWAASFYWLIVEEVHDNIDDGLENSKNQIIKRIVRDPSLLQINNFGIGNFKITELPRGDYSSEVHIFNSEVFMDIEDENQPVRMLQTIFESNGRNYQLNIYASTMENDDFLVNLLIALIVLYFFLTFTILLINHFVLNKAWRSFYTILDKLNHYKLDQQKGYEKTKSMISEFNELDNELSALTHRNEKIYKQQTQFIGNASHEIQTPLAIASNKLELLLDEDNLTEKTAVKINEVNQILNRLKRLNRSLLMLTKIENNPLHNTEKTNFNKLIDDILDELEDLISHQKIKFVKKEISVFNFEINLDFAKILLMNLLKNAIVHSPENSEISIRIEQREISFHNSGQTALNPEIIFERFQKDSKNENSTGLGLSICRSIVKLYPELSLEYRYKNEHIFLIRKNQ